MKKVLTAIITFALFTTTVLAQNKTINTAESKVVWKGYKVTGAHQGTIALQSGDLIFKDNVLTGGAFVIDMTTINTTDLEGEYKGKFEGHIKSDDFFGVEKFTTSKLVFTKVEASGKNSYTVTGDLTIKDKTNPVTVNVSVYGSKATATLKVDRTKFDVRYGSTSFFDGLKDKAIYDEFDLVVDLQF